MTGMRGLRPPGLRLRRCALRGAAALLAVLLLAGLAGAALTVWHGVAERQRSAALDREAGRVFALWFLALHEAAQRGLAPAAVWSAGEAATVTPAQVEAWGTAPPGLHRHAGRDAALTLGLMDDGGGVPMAFAVLAPGAGGAASMRRGAVEAGLADVAEAGGTAGAMSGHAPALASALGLGALPDGALFATADRAVARRGDHLWRRAQPGRPELSRMRTDLALGGADLVGAGAVEGVDGAAAGASVAGDAAVAGAASVGGDLTAREALSAALGLEAGSLAATGAASAGSAAISGAVEAASAAISGDLRSGTLTAPVLAAGSLASSSWARGAAGAVSGAMSVGRCTGCGF